MLTQNHVGRYRLGVVAAALLLVAGTTFAGPVTYEVVTDIAGNNFGSTLTGTITFPMSAIGTTSFDITMAAGFDIDVVEAPGSPLPNGPGEGWHSAIPGHQARGTVAFQGGAIGDPLLRPKNPGAFGELWAFFNTGTLAGTPFELDLVAFSVSDARGWFYSSGTALHDIGPHGAGTDTAWHLVRVDADPVPEPTAFMFLALGVGVLMRRRKRAA